MLGLTKEEAEMERARGQVYAFFSALLLNPPTAERLEALFAPEVEAALELLFPEHPGVEIFKKVSRRQRSGRRLDEDFLLDYEALFRVPGPSYVHPFESVYRHGESSQDKGAKAALWGPETKEVAGIYQKEGLQPQENFNELPDHLGVELEFASFLSRKCAAALEREEREEAKVFREKRTSFLREHLIQWSGKCLARVRQNASTPLYAALAMLLESFLEGEQSPRLDAANL